MLTNRRVQQLTSDGVLLKEGRGKYPLIPNVQNYIKYWQDRAAGSDADESDFATENLRLKKLTADKMDLEVKQMRGDLVSAEDVRDLLSQLMSNCRSKLLTLPGRAAQSAIDARDVKTIEKDIRDMVYESLEEISDGLKPLPPETLDISETASPLNG